ncbi:MAG: (Fe-S)-binding protein [Smithellaceae bacterium]|nr:(Fe-S)-binding protein [Smithellaceae bacterium]
MDHNAPLGNFNPGDAPSYESILQCMRCGFCLPHCPTYSLTNRERSSPRGRAALARAIAEGKLEFTPAFREEAFFCLECRACATACPSGVQVGPMMELCRGQAHAFYPPKAMDGFLRTFILKKMLPSPRLMETSLIAPRLYQRLGLQWAVRQLGIKQILPDLLNKMEGILPELKAPLRPRLPEFIPARGEKRGRVGFFLGCAMSLMFPEVSRQTARILSHQGFDVFTPREVKCCGAPHLAEGDRETARELALINLRLFDSLQVDYIVTDCAGCGCALKEYDELIHHQTDREKLQRFTGQVKDISEFLSFMGLRTEGLVPVSASVTYHEPCHLAHGQKISLAPREILRQIPGITFKEMDESSWCCGMAGSFALKYLEESRAILKRKLANASATGAELLITANPGCHLQLAWGVREGQLNMPVLHIVELLGRAIPGH